MRWVLDGRYWETMFVAREHRSRVLAPAIWCWGELTPTSPRCSSLKPRWKLLFLNDGKSPDSKHKLRSVWSAVAAKVAPPTCNINYRFAVKHADGRQSLSSLEWIFIDLWPSTRRLLRKAKSVETQVQALNLKQVLVGEKVSNSAITKCSWNDFVKWQLSFHPQHTPQQLTIITTMTEGSNYDYLFKVIHSIQILARRSQKFTFNRLSWLATRVSGNR